LRNGATMAPSTRGVRGDRFSLWGPIYGDLSKGIWGQSLQRSPGKALAGG